jgi:hypothetical protein
LSRSGVGDRHELGRLIPAVPGPQANRVAVRGARMPSCFSSRTSTPLFASRSEPHRSPGRSRRRSAPRGTYESGNRVLGLLGPSAFMDGRVRSVQLEAGCRKNVPACGLRRGLTRPLGAQLSHQHRHERNGSSKRDQTHGVHNRHGQPPLPCCAKANASTYVESQERTRRALWNPSPPRPLSEHRGPILAPTTGRHSKPPHRGGFSWLHRPKLFGLSPLTAVVQLGRRVVPSH